MREFAKLFVVDHEQVLVIRSDADSPQLVITFKPDDSEIDLVHIGATFTDPERGQEQRDEAFDNLSQADVEAAVRQHRTLIADAKAERMH